jgi:NADPH-dependent glutamate synthase beta subunit-like oxidoreductase
VLKGHAVTLLEASECAGSMPALSVPAYRLPQAVLNKDTAAIRELGVEIRTGCRLESSSAMTALLEDGFDALLIAVGLPNSRKITIEGS